MGIMVDTALHGILMDGIPDVLFSSLPEILIHAAMEQGLRHQPNGLVVAEFASQYRLQPRADF